MQVRGTVSPPGARVRVQGHVAQVSGGEFISSVKLAQGANVIDVVAAASGRAAAMTAFRVTREERVAVPDLAGLSVDDAQQAADEARPQARGRARRRLPRLAACRADRRLRAGARPGQAGPPRDDGRACSSPAPADQLRGVTAIRPMRGSPRSRTMPSTIRPSIGSPSSRSTR